jgi:DNA-binding beta-propeller fold protein YncE
VATAGDGRVERVNGDANARAGSVRVGGSPRAIVAGGQRLWVADQARDRLVAVDPETMRVAGQQPTPPRPSGLAADRNSVWVAGADRVARLHG